MFLCKVTGTAVAPRKNESFRPAKMLIVQPIDAAGTPTGDRDLLALDPGYGAGPSDVVLVAKEGAVVNQLMDAGETSVPANVIVLGVVDDWTYTPAR